VRSFVKEKAMGLAFGSFKENIFSKIPFMGGNK
jgi:hypothetical protein